MKKLIAYFAVIAMAAPNIAQEPAPSPTRGDVAGYTSRDATVLSMMGWGISLAVGVAALCALIDNSSTTSHTH